MKHFLVENSKTFLEENLGSARKSILYILFGSLNCSHERKKNNLKVMTLKTVEIKYSNIATLPKSYFFPLGNKLRKILSVQPFEKV